MNTLAYNVKEFTIVVISFIVQALGANLINLNVLDLLTLFVISETISNSKQQL
jgi:hypothetical protein